MRLQAASHCIQTNARQLNENKMDCYHFSLLDWLSLVARTMYWTPLYRKRHVYIHFVTLYWIFVSYSKTTIASIFGRRKKTLWTIQQEHKRTVRFRGCMSHEATEQEVNSSFLQLKCGIHYWKQNQNASCALMCQFTFLSTFTWLQHFQFHCTIAKIIVYYECFDNKLDYHPLYLIIAIYIPLNIDFHQFQ